MGVLKLSAFGGCSSLLLYLLLLLLLLFLFSVWSLVCPEEIQNRLAGSHTRTHDEVDTRGSLVGCPRYAAVVFYLLLFFFSFLSLCLVRRHFGSFLVILGDPF